VVPIAAYAIPRHPTRSTAGRTSFARVPTDQDDHAYRRQGADCKDGELPYPAGRFAAEIFAVPQLDATRRPCYTSAVLGPPVVLHELIAVAIHPRVTILTDAPESADERSADARYESDERNPPQHRTPSACHVKTPLDPAVSPAVSGGDTGAKRSPR
jgi:hypothetical protein